MKKSLLITFLFLFPSTALFAQSSNDKTKHFYLAAGASRIQIETSADVENANLDFDDSETAFNVRAGYMFTNWVGLEMAYYDFGNFEDSIAGIRDNFRFDNVELDLDLKGYGLSFVGNLPLDYLDLYLKAGGIRLDGEATVGAFGFTVSVDKSTTVPFAALGAEINLGNINLFAEYTKILDNDDVEVELASAGIKFEF